MTLLIETDSAVSVRLLRVLALAERLGLTVLRMAVNCIIIQLFPVLICTQSSIEVPSSKTMSGRHAKHNPHIIWICGFGRTLITGVSRQMPSPR